MSKLHRDTAPDVRGDRASDDAQRTANDGTISAEELQELLNSEFDQTALPRPPELPGWHLCYLTTTSSYDTIQKRMRYGYVPVKREDMPGFDPSNGKALVGQEGLITCNEMVLFKIREELHQKMMHHYHHVKPLEDEGALVANAVGSKQDSAGRRLGQTEGDGFTDMEESVRRNKNATPTFS